MTSPRHTGSCRPNHRIAPLLLSLALLPLLGGCASGGGGGSSSRDVLTPEDLQDWEGRSLESAIQSMRPRWLRSRGNTSIRFGEESVKVILDGAVIGDASEQLPQISVDVVREVRYLDAREATTRYGTGFGGGAIEIRTRGD